MALGRFRGATRRRASAIVLLFLAFLMAGTACGRKEDGGPVAGGPGTAGTAPAAGQPAPQAPAAGVRHLVDVDPLIPCRIAPPGVTVRPTPGQVKEVAAVRWYVNGAAAEIGPRLSPSAFRRGDRILAAVTLRVDGVETLATTREVLAGNSPPSVTGVRAEPENPVSGGAIRVSSAGSDADGDAVRVRYEWYIDNVLTHGNEESVVLKGVKRGSIVHVRAIPNDGIVDGAWEVSPGYRVVNGLPVVKSQVPKEMPSDGRFVHRIEAEDPDGDPLTYTLRKAPPGMTLNGSTLEWQVPDGFLGRPFDVVVEISDGQGGSTVQNISMTIQPPPKPQAAAP